MNFGFCCVAAKPPHNKNNLTKIRNLFLFEHRYPITVPTSFTVFLSVASVSFIIFDKVS